MSTNMKIFQIYYKPEQLAELDPAFEPCDNTDNPRPELREWHVWDREYKKCCKEKLDYWGFVSWKFKDKSNLNGQEVIDFINQNPGYDLYLINPCIVNEAVFVNSWEQGDIHHPDISKIGNIFLEKIGIKDPAVKDVVLDRNATTFANYIVGSRAFWDKFIKFTKQIFEEADNDPEFKEMVFGLGRSNYAHDKSLPMFTFLIERLIPTFIDMNKIKAMPFTYSADNLPEKYKNIIGDIMALSDLKVAINRYDSDELYEIWNYYRVKFLKENKGVLGLE